MHQIVGDKKHETFRGALEMKDDLGRRNATGRRVIYSYLGRGRPAIKLYFIGVTACFFQTCKAH